MTKFEDSMKRLEEIVNILEKGEKDLDESLKLFEEGLKLSKALQKDLKVNEKKIDELVQDEDQ